ncbi:hypothetical protein Slin15195_G115120 [Septoria linicola]|uniref:Uncharacterized protein n=1 Tax=Septoria linicola TaxID=215465 RepID=A0A9Q9B3C8_9PEZI|nr:hypothetical protein Slin15195_G115120 [Septoria linicola]
MPQAPAASTVRRVEDHRNLSAEFKQLELNDSQGSNSHQRGRHGGSAGSAHVADQYARRPGSQHLENGSLGKDGAPRSIPFASVEDPYSEAVADFNVARDESMLAGGLEDKHAIRQALQRDQREDGVQPRRSRDVNRDVINVRRSNDLARPGSSRQSNEASRNAIPVAAIPSREASLDWQQQNAGSGRPRANTGKRLSVDKALAPAPEGQAVKNFSTPSTQPRPQPEHLVHDSDTPIGLAAHGIDLRDTEDTTVYTTQAPAVVHEQIRVDTHEIITERVEREIHTHDVFHRILPIVDVEVLPPRHFIQTPEGGRYEISPAQAPGGAAQNLNLQRVIQEAVDREVARMYPPQIGPRPFTAIDFNPWTTAGDKREGVGKDGVRYSEQTWVHPPTLETAGYEAGQTVPFHFDHAGVQTSAGGVVGSGAVVYDDHEGGTGRLSTAELRRASVTTRKPVPH